MTASRRRRRRSMWIALGASVVGLVVATVLGGVAVVSLSNSTAGRNAADELDLADSVQRLPWTSTALIGVVDESSELTSTVVAVLPPDGRGGTLVSVSPSADASSGTASTIRPLGAVFAVDGPEAWRAAVEQLTGLSFDVAEVVDADRFADLVGPLGDLPTVFPYDFVDAQTDTLFEAGPTVLSSAAAARAVTALNAEGPSWQFDAGRDAVWDAVANRVGAGIGSLPAGVRYQEGNPPRDLDAFLDALFAAPVDFRALAASQIDPATAAEAMPLAYAEALGIDFDDAAVMYDRTEVVMVFASIAPSRVGAPLDGPTVRLVSGFTDQDAEPLGLNRSDVIAKALHVLLFTQANVRSVVDGPGGPVPARTQIRVADPDMVDRVWQIYDVPFGGIQVSVADTRIQGIDLEIVLGRDYLSAFDDTPTDTSVAGSDS